MSQFRIGKSKLGSSDLLGGPSSTPVGIVDSATGSDTLLLEAAVTPTDSGVGTDTLSVVATEPVDLTDSGTASLEDLAVFEVTSVDMVETGGINYLDDLNERLSVLVTHDLIDSGSFGDYLSGGYQVAMSDWGSTHKRRTTPPTFSRASVAYKSNGEAVAAAAARFETIGGRTGLKIEEGTTNYVRNSRAVGTVGSPETPTNWSSTFESGIVLTRTVLEDPDRPGYNIYEVRVQNTGGVSRNFWTYFDTAAVAVVGQPWSMAVDAWLVSGSVPAATSFGPGVWWHASVGGAYVGESGVNVTPSTSRTRLKAENRIAPAGSGAARPGFRMYNVQPGADFTIRLAMPQLEQRAYATSHHATSNAVATRVDETATIPVTVVDRTKGSVEISVDFNAHMKNGVGEKYLFDARGSDIGHYIILRVIGANLNVISRDGVTTTTSNYALSNIALGIHDLALTWSATERVLYVDGVAVSTAVAPALPQELATVGIGTAQTGTLRQPNTVISDIRISNRARTASEITALYTSGAPAPVDDATTYKANFDGDFEADTYFNGEVFGDINVVMQDLGVAVENMPIGLSLSDSGAFNDIITEAELAFQTPREVVSPMSATISEATPTTPDAENNRVMSLKNTVGAQQRVLLDVPLTDVTLDTEVLRSDLKLYAAATLPGAFNLVLEPIDAEWDANGVTWANQPTTRSAEAITVAIGAGAVDGTELTARISTMVKNIVSGRVPWYGLMLKVSTASEVRLYSSYAPHNYRPDLKIETSTAPEAPFNLVPSGGKAISLQKGEFIGRILDRDLEDTLSAIQWQEASSEDFDTDLIYDSGKVYTNSPRFDKASPPSGAPATSNTPFNTERWWRMKGWDNHDLEGPYNVPVSYIVIAKGVLTLTGPSGSTVTSPFPTFSHGFTEVQRMAHTFVEVKVDGVWLMHHDFGQVISTQSSFTLPDSAPLQEGYDYRRTTKVWDNVDRADLPNDRAFVEATQEFTLAGVSI